MDLLLKILTFVAIFAALVFFHELGHFLFAKLFRMRVEEFALGMGVPKLRLFSDGETEYTLRAIPLGGFVRIAGMEIEDAYEARLTGAGAREGRASDISPFDETNAGTMKQEAEEVAGADPNGFNSRPIYQRFLVILAGPVFSILLGYAAFCLTFGLFGFPEGPVTTTIQSVLAGKPADQAGIRPGDAIVSVNGKPTGVGDDVIAQIRASNGKAVTLGVRRAGGAGAVDQVPVTPRVEVNDGDKVPVIGVLMEEHRRPVGAAEAMRLGARSVGVFFTLVGRVFASGHAKDAVGGPVAIARAVGQAHDMGPDASLSLLAQLSLSLGLFNLFPIPVLDGGHLALLTLEAIRRRKLTAAQTQRVFATGLAVLGLLFVYVMVKDLFLSS